jgi:hypothetical protein
MHEVIQTPTYNVSDTLRRCVPFILYVSVVLTNKCTKNLLTFIYFYSTPCFDTSVLSWGSCSEFESYKPIKMEFIITCRSYKKLK